MTRPDSYSVYIRDASGVEVGRTNQLISLDYTLTNNAIGKAKLVLMRGDMPNDIDEMLRWVDAWAEVWRSPGGEAEQYEGAFLLQNAVSYRRGNETVVEFEGFNGNILLDWRTVLPGSATKSGNADNLARAFVREHAGALAGARAYPSTVFTVDADTTNFTPTINLDGSGKTLLQVCTDACLQSAQLGTPLYFDVQVELGKMMLRMYPTRRGVVRSEYVFSQDNNTLSPAKLLDSFDGARSHVYATGAGQGSNQLLGQATNTALAGARPFGRREILVNASTAKTQSIADGEAIAALRRYRASSALTANITNRPGSAYGQAWRHGDEILCQEQGRVFLCSVDNVSVSVANGRSEVSATARSQYELPL